MKYRLTYTQRAARDFRGLQSSTKERIGKTLQRYAEDPMKYAEKLSDARLGTYRFRIGAYRIIFDLEEDEIVILRVGHRTGIYKK